jgi:endonuclease I
VVNNPDNIIPFPRRLNNARGNRKYIDKINDGYLVYSCDSCPNPGFCSGAGFISASGFVPPESLKGPVARSVLKGIMKHPKFTEKISDEVLDYDLAIQWDRQYPMSTAEWNYRSNSN